MFPPPTRGSVRCCTPATHDIWKTEPFFRSAISQVGTKFGVVTFVREYYPAVYTPQP